MKLSVLYPQDLIKILHKLGFLEVRQKGSHKTFEHLDGRILTVAFHSNKPIPPGLLNKIIKFELKMERDEFMKMA
ncbi:MAG: type II toxin-antitoxin system HicA family toxin [Candidatus Diapherotrites archaeon]